MSKTESYRKQHGELLGYAGKISPLLNEKDAKKNAGEIRKTLSEMIGKLQIHLTMEDKALYPAMMKSPDKGVRETATKFNAEMGGIKAVVTSFSSKWTSDAIEKSPAEFCKECGGIFSALAKRIEAEDAVLYDMYDKLL